MIGLYFGVFLGAICSTLCTAHLLPPEMGPQSCVSCTQTQHTLEREKGEREGKKNKKKLLSSFLSFHLFFISLSCTFTPSSHFPPLSCSFTPVVSPPNPHHQESRKSERRKFPNKSLWHREHLLAYCEHSSSCARSKSRWRLQYVSSLWTFSNRLWDQSQGQVVHLPLENSH